MRFLRRAALALVVVCSFIAILTALMPARSAIAQPAAAAPGARVRIGFYDSRAVAVAYIASSFHEQEMRGLQQSLKAAQDAGDTKKADALKQEGANRQALAHLQGFGNAPVDQMLAAINDRLPQIARTANVQAIVANADYLSVEVERFDITDQLVAEFKPNERTLKNIDALRKTPPIPMIQLLGHRD